MILRDDRSWLGEPAGGKGSDVDRRRTAGNEIGDNFAGHRCGGHADMAVAKGVDDVRRSTRPTKNRQRVGQARAMAHPDRDPLFGVGGGEAGQHLAALSEQYPGAPPIGGCGETGEFDGASEAQPGVHWRRDEFAVGIGRWNARHDLGIADHQVIPALGFERDAVTECDSERL